MLRTGLSRCNSLSSSFASTSWFHSSAPSLASRSGGRQKKIKLSKKAKTEIKEKRYLKAQADRPSPITGVKIGEENKWFASDLAKVIVRPDELTAPSDNVVTQPIGLVTLPSRLAFGLSNAETEETQKLFGDLPELSSTAEALGVQYQDLLTERLEKGQRRELLKANQFAKLVDLRNADAKGLAFENRRRIIAAFSTPENPFDTGRSEVQAALLTYKIRNMWDHLTTNKRDINNRQGLLKLIHQRAKVLKYLKKTNRVRYDTILGRLCLEPASVEGELVI